MIIKTVLPTVDLDHDPLLEAGKVHDEMTNRNLPAKVQARWPK
jgi:hypothetical protein